MSRSLVPVAAFSLRLLAGGAANPAPRPSGASGAGAPGATPDGANPFETARQRIVPIIDAHQHMMGPVAMTTLSRAPAPPAISVSGPVQSLLDRRQREITAENFGELYTSDAQAFAEDQGRWWTGKDQVLDAVQHFGTGWRFEPTSYAAQGQSGYVSGIVRDDTGAESYEFVLGLRKVGGGWRIASEMKQKIMPAVYAPSIQAEQVIGVLNDAGIRYATVLSVGYWFGKPSLKLTRAERIAGMRAENDWTIAQTQKYPDRLLPFCGVNPIDDFALDELRRCAAIPAVRGMKMHRRNGRFDVSDPEIMKRVQGFFREANALRMPIVIHLADDPRPWIEHVFPLAPDIPIQIAHMGSGWSNAAIFADAIQANKPGTRNLWFDWTQADPIEGWWGYGPSAWLGGTLTEAEREEHANIMRRLGLGRILYGSDMALAWNPTPRDWWRRTILTLPLSDAEIRDIADNQPPYLKCHRVCPN